MASGDGDRQQVEGIVSVLDGPGGQGGTCVRIHCGVPRISTLLAATEAV
jgi:hypothetical protein